MNAADTNADSVSESALTHTRTHTHARSRTICDRYRFVVSLVRHFDALHYEDSIVRGGVAIINTIATYFILLCFCVWFDLFWVSEGFSRFVAVAAAAVIDCVVQFEFLRPSVTAVRWRLNASERVIFAHSSAMRHTTNTATSMCTCIWKHSQRQRHARGRSSSCSELQSSVTFMHVAVLVFVSTLAERMRVRASERDSRQVCAVWLIYT